MRSMRLTTLTQKQMLANQMRIFATCARRKALHISVLGGVDCWARRDIRRLIQPIGHHIIHAPPHEISRVNSRIGLRTNPAPLRLRQQQQPLPGRLTIALFQVVGGRVF